MVDLPTLDIPLDLSVPSHNQLFIIGKSLACGVEFGIPVPLRAHRRAALLAAAQVVLEELQLVTPDVVLHLGSYELETHTAASSAILSIVDFQVEEELPNNQGRYIFRFECPPVL